MSHVAHCLPKLKTCETLAAISKLTTTTLLFPRNCNYAIQLSPLARMCPRAYGSRRNNGLFLQRTVDTCHVLWRCLNGVGLLDRLGSELQVQVARRIQGLHSSCSSIPTRT
ncbi:hypothetical protein BDW62DRAFT_89373 [Aspergillus aurantiobrunneus]